MKTPDGQVKKFVAYFYFVGWDCISLGLHICVSEPNIEIHLPFGFVRVGWSWVFLKEPWKDMSIKKRAFGIAEKYVDGVLK